MAYPHIKFSEKPLRNLDEDYKHALIHLSWFWSKEEGRATIIFALIELFPKALPMTTGFSWLKKRVGKQNSISLKRIPTTAAVAMNWYKKCCEGRAIEIDDNGKMVDITDGGNHEYRLLTLSMEPPWPDLVTTGLVDDGRPPFIPGWQVCPRLSQLVPTDQYELEQIWTEKERANSIEWLSERLFFDLDIYNELIGSINLLIPNPIFRNVHQKLVKKPNFDSEDSVSIKLQLWPERTIDGLELSFLEKRPSGQLLSKDISILGLETIVDIGHRVGEFGITISSPEQGLLFWEKPLHFLRSIRTDFNFSVGKQPFALLDGQSGDELETIERPVVGSMQSIIGESSLYDGYQALYAANNNRKKIADAKRLEQEIFWQNPEKAKEWVKKKVRQARSDVLIVDPYFVDPRAFFVYGLTPYNPNVTIRFLTSKQGLKQNYKDNTLMEVTKLEKLCSEMASTNHVGPIECKIMTGNKAACHDRFIVADNKVWLLGSSLNNLGDRLTVIIKAPYPEEILNYLTDIWEESEKIGDWVKRNTKKTKDQDRQSENDKTQDS